MPLEQLLIVCDVGLFERRGTTSRPGSIPTVRTAIGMGQEPGPIQPQAGNFAVEKLDLF